MNENQFEIIKAETIAKLVFYTIRLLFMLTICGALLRICSLMEAFLFALR